MKTSEIIKEIQKLPLRKRIYVLERSIHLLRKQEDLNQLEKGVEELLEDYLTDRELTAFKDLDFEQFYETRTDRVD